MSRRLRHAWRSPTLQTLCITMIPKTIFNNFSRIYFARVRLLSLFHLSLSRQFVSDVGKICNKTAALHFTHPTTPCPEHCMIDTTKNLGGKSFCLGSIIGISGRIGNDKEAFHFLLPGPHGTLALINRPRTKQFHGFGFWRVHVEKGIVSMRMRFRPGIALSYSQHNNNPSISILSDPAISPCISAVTNIHTPFALSLSIFSSLLSPTHELKSQRSHKVNPGPFSPPVRPFLVRPSQSVLHRIKTPNVTPNLRLPITCRREHGQVVHPSPPIILLCDARQGGSTV
ncbi:hypothetical protein B0H65DRAFT_225278 [Neurospora tetraspora]|uniref:Uncharacterized protein n=1 Tax=Neurospora tetraspora TaxID=94610 RepID=A0AAE0JCR0_9PEZI|nr:hypothetical protein B0H65DRAFT_225278 [Neurospora tetraspora]